MIENSTIAVGARFGRLVILSISDKTNPRGFHWVTCNCDCGGSTTLSERFLTRPGNAVKSCGCLVKSREYRVWASAKYRCSSPKSQGWEDYGGRGITMCQKWKEDFWAFLSDMGFCADGLSIERVNPNGNYEPGNCIWATDKAQTRNRRSTKLSVKVVHEIRRLASHMTQAKLAAMFSVNQSTIYRVINRLRWAEV